MSPKEKAEELVNYFMELKHVKLADYSRIEWPTAKKCALKVVNEIISSIKDEHVSDIFNEYWEEVKQEIENL
jgi:hypothetical protein